VLQTVAIYEVLQRTDLYISLYSQTLFEASCLGIPSIYYKKDKEYLDPPFDNKSELVTVDNVIALKQAFLDFKVDAPRFDAFLDKSIMEKYIGPLDGKNLERNLDFIYDILHKQNIGQLH
jgi:CDP-glycerol glycerophosphotransferase (TagB/SpsB family)